MFVVTQRSFPRRSPLRRAGVFALVAGLLALGGCSRDKIMREGRVSRAQADQYMRDAIRQSSEGVVLEPQQKALHQIERTRLNEIAHEIRRPAAACFLERAIMTMEPGEVEGEQGWVEVPEGQIKIRARIAIDGTVMTADVLESGFTDPDMVACLTEVITNQRFVESRDSFAYFVDVYYWVSLGFFAEAQTAEFAEHMRRQQAEAGLRARTCLTGRVPPGEYIVTGLNLFDRDGRTVINRIDRGELPAEVSACIAAAFKQIRIPAERDAFVRPAAPRVEFAVAADGLVSIADERWLELVQLEEQAQREMRRAALLDQVGEGSQGEHGEVPDGLTDHSFEDLGELALPDDGAPSFEEPASKPEPAPEPKPQPQGDPSKPGTKIQLSPRGGR
jgi:hypothetical protein